MNLPAHVIVHLNSADERQQRAVQDAVTRARYEERDRFADERRVMGNAVKLLSLLRYQPDTDTYVVTRVELADAGLLAFVKLTPSEDRS